MPTMTANIREGSPRDHRLLEAVDARREVGDSRSPILRDMIGAGLAAHEVLEEFDIEFEGDSEEEIAEAREELIREALRAYLSEGAETERQTSSA